MICGSSDNVKKCKLKGAIQGSSIVPQKGTHGYQQVEAKKKPKIPVSQLRADFIQNQEVLSTLQAQANPDGTGNNEYWRLFEKEYIVLRLGEIVGSLKQTEEQLLRVIDNPRKNTPLQERKAELRAIQHELKQILQTQNHDRIESIVAGLHQDYVFLMKKAVQAGCDIDPKIRKQYKIEFEKVKQDMKRFKKAENTAQSNMSAGIDKLALDKLGFKMKMQNGKRVKKAERNEVKFAIQEVFDAMESNADTLKKMFKMRNLTIVHTDGKRPFLSPMSTSKFLPANTLMAIGWKSEFDQDTRIPQAAQKTGEFIDMIPVESNGRWYPSFLSESEGSAAFIAQAVDTINSPSASMLKMPLKLRSKYLVNKTEQEVLDFKRQRENFLRISGRRWSKPRQVWARAYEQYVASQSEKHGKKDTFATENGGYEYRAGYWDKESWAKLEPLFEKELEKRFDIHKRSISEIESGNKKPFN